MPPENLATELLTVEDHRATAEGTRHQLIEVDFIMSSPAPNTNHQRFVRNFSQILCDHGARHGLSEIFFAPCDVYLSEHDVVQPDLLFVAQPDLAIIAEDVAHGPPDLVVNVLACSTAQLDKKQKRRGYAQVGVKEMRLVDPLVLPIQRYDFVRDTAKPFELSDETETFSASPLSGLRLAASEIFRHLGRAA